MIPRHWQTMVSALFFCLALAAAVRAKAQSALCGLAYSCLGQLGVGYGSTPFGGYGASSYGSSPYGYGIRTGRVGSGYQGAAGLYNRAYAAARPQTVTNFQPLISAITMLPGWNAPAYRPRRRLHYSRPRASAPPFDDNGKIIWPSTIPSDPASDRLRQVAEDAVKAVVLESKSTGHGSVRPVIDAKKKLSAFEHAVLPAVKDKNATDGAALERFFFDLDKALDVLTYTF